MQSVSLTPLCQFEGDFLVDFAEYHYDNEVQYGRRHTGHGARLRSKGAWSVAGKRNSDQNPVNDDSDDKYQNQTDLPTKLTSFHAGGEKQQSAKLDLTNLCSVKLAEIVCF